MLTRIRGAFLASCVFHCRLHCDIGRAAITVASDGEHLRQQQQQQQQHARSYLSSLLCCRITRYCILRQTTSSRTCGVFEHHIVCMRALLQMYVSQDVRIITFQRSFVTPNFNANHTNKCSHQLNTRRSLVAQNLERRRKRSLERSSHIDVVADYTLSTVGDPRLLLIEAQAANAVVTRFAATTAAILAKSARCAAL